MIAAVTGGTGFIGRNLVARLLERGDSVRLLTRRPTLPFPPAPRLERCECDLRTVEPRDLGRMLEGVEVLYHCAGQLTDESGMRALHVEATGKLAEAAHRRVGHWVQLSSVGVYGPVMEGEISENSPLNPAGEYETTKAESDRIVTDAGATGGFTFCILRPSIVFGAGMPNQSLYRMIAMIDRGFFFFIGKRGASANYIHVRNVAQALVACGTQPEARGQVFNLSDHRPIEHFVATIAAVLGRPLPRLRISRPLALDVARLLGRIPDFPLTLARVNALSNRSSYPFSRIRQELEFHPEVTMEAGLRELAEDYLRRKHFGSEASPMPRSSRP